ncbi:T9SS type A sorting domain-containing protein [bacterium]|nr:T9SS type A sorting domain-containing protein [bacterium]
MYSSISENRGIGFYSDLDSNTIISCVFARNTNNGIYSNYGYLTLSLSNFINNENSAIKEWSSGIEIDSCEFSYNSALVGAALYSTGYVRIDRSLFKSNTAEIKGGAIYSGSRFAAVNITNSVFFDNTADSGSVYFGYPTFIINTIIFQNNGTEAIYTRDGLLGSYNSLYFENGNNVTFAEDSHYSENFGHLDSENANGEVCDLYENIFLNPQLIDPANNNFHPLEISPCIDAGTTEAGLIDSLSDPDGGLVDIGIHYFNQNAVLTPRQTSNPSLFQLNSVYPNPFNSQITLSVEIPKPQPYTFFVHDILGRQISRKSYTLSPGNHQLSWVASENMAAGVYYLTLRSSQQSQSVRIFYVK